MFTNLTTAINAAIDGESKGTVTFRNDPSSCSTLGFRTDYFILTFLTGIINRETLYFKCYDLNTPLAVKMYETRLALQKNRVTFNTLTKIYLGAENVSSLTEKAPFKSYEILKLIEVFNAVKEYFKKNLEDTLYGEIREANNFIQGFNIESFISKKCYKEFVKAVKQIRRKLLIFKNENGKGGLHFDVNSFNDELHALMEKLSQAVKLCETLMLAWQWDALHRVIEGDNVVFYFTCGDQETKHYRFINGNVVEYTNALKSLKEPTKERKSIVVKDSRKRHQNTTTLVEEKEGSQMIHDKQLSTCYTPQRLKQTKSMFQKCNGISPSDKKKILTIDNSFLDKRTDSVQNLFRKKDTKLNKSVFV